MQHSLTGKRVLITQAGEFMGPALCEVLDEQCAEVVAFAQASGPQGGAGALIVLLKG